VPADVEDLPGVVVEVVAQLGQPVALAKRMEPLRDGEVEAAACPRRRSEERLAPVPLRLALPEPGVQLGGRQRLELHPRRGMARLPLLGGFESHRDRGARDFHHAQHRMAV